MVCRRVALLAVMATFGTATASPVRLQIDDGVCKLDSLERQLTQLVGSDPVDSTADASVHVEVRKAHDTFEARVSFDDGNGDVRGRRILTSSTCNDLVASVAIVIAMVLSDRSPAPTVTDSAPPAESVVEPEQPAEPSPGTTQRQASAEPTTTRPWVIAHDETPPANPVNIDLITAGAGGVTSRGVQGQLIIGVRLRRDSASVTGELRADAPEEVSVDRMGSIGVFRSQASISPCMHLGSVAACGLLSVGAVRGAGTGLASPRSVYTPLVASGVRVTWERPLGRGLAVRLHVDADALLTTTQFDVDNMKVWVSPRFEGSAGLGVIAHIP